MRQRRLCLICSDDEADADPPMFESRGTPEIHQQWIPQIDACLPQSPSTIEISDEETGGCIDVSEDLSTPSLPRSSTPHLAASSIPTLIQAAPSAPLNSGHASSFDCLVSDYLGSMGIMLRREWLHDCLDRLKESVHDFPDLDVSAKTKLCFEQFLLSDMNYSGSGALPANVDSLHLVDLAGPFVLQVDEIVNISCPLRGRYQSASAGLKRCLKLSMTDGAQRVFGMEYRPIKDLEALSPAGLKVALRNVHIRRGLLMLVPEAVEVLGGMENGLEAARERLVHEVNKPPRGRRNRLEGHPPLSTRATQAAWTPDNAYLASGDHSMEDAINPRAEEIETASVPPATITDMISPLGTAISLDAQNEVSNSSTNFISNFEEMHVDDVNRTKIVLESPTNLEGMHVDSFPTNITLTSMLPKHTLAVGDTGLESQATDGENMLHDPVSPDQEVDKTINDIEPSKILCIDQESPFTYLACLLAKWTGTREKVSSIEGKVKCLLTGVKGFMYKQRQTYELRVYVDDGSLICEILIDHNVVQNGIGHTPEEVTAALASEDKNVVSRMRETLKQFQLFLSNFEGIMLIEMNETSPVPIARQLTEVCPSSDAQLLLERLRYPLPALHHSSCFIDLSL
ncbi:hypothetical protein SAY87_032235 [Trapa incisa]|uniref:RecQ-mediated genome instability protein 1 n=1 Tax=Trapa incisa TaxID=236973 RepID=A0AAN7KLU7_9MYRT|nr:hypothetical protein SAY87_032235 [Trapa incisa]